MLVLGTIALLGMDTPLGGFLLGLALAWIWRDLYEPIEQEVAKE